MHFDYFKPKTIEETLSLLNESAGANALIAGGTDLIPKMKSGVIKVERLINLEDVSQLKKIEYNSESGLTFGATVTLRELEAVEHIKEKYRALYEGVHSMASTQIRNTATVAGNLCNAVPSADTAPALIALNAKITITGPEESKVVDVEDFFTGVCETVLQKGEIVTEINVPPRGEAYDSTYIKYTVRKALELAMAGVAVSLKERNGICEDIRIGLGAVAPVPKRAFHAEHFLMGKELTQANILKASQIAGIDDCAPISDMRASEEYRREMVKICLKDAILGLIGKQGGVS